MNLNMDNKLSTWLARELNDRSWSARELARKIGLSHTSVSRYIEGNRIPNARTCVKIAQAFNLPDPQVVLRLAGHLPPLAPPVLEENEVLAILRDLPDQTRAIALQMLRGLRPTITYANPRALAETPPQYTPLTLDDEIAILNKRCPKLETFFTEARATLSDEAVWALIANVKIWLKLREQFARFNDDLFNLLRSA